MEITPVPDCPTCDGYAFLGHYCPPRGHLMKIFLTAYPLNSGSGRVHGSTPGGDVLGCALAEDGQVLAEHLSSSIGFAQHDLGLTSNWQHEHYQRHCPDGFELEWVEDRATHAGWQAAIARNKALAPVEPEAER